MPENGKEKKSIDEILSDLNNLLNKMPKIMEGITLPDMKPVEFDKIASEKFIRESKEPERAEAQSTEREMPREVKEPVSEKTEIPLPSEDFKPVPEEAEFEIGLDSVINETSEISGAKKEDSAPEFPAEAESAEIIPENGGESVLLENTSDFGVPDIDSLFEAAGKKTGKDGGEMEEKEKNEEEVQSGSGLSAGNREILPETELKESDLIIPAPENGTEHPVSLPEASPTPASEGIPALTENQPPVADPELQNPQEGEAVLSSSLDLGFSETENREKAEETLPQVEKSSAGPEAAPLELTSPGSAETSPEETLEVKAEDPAQSQPKTDEPDFSINVGDASTAEKTLDEDKTVIMAPETSGDSTVVFTPETAPSETSRTAFSDEDMDKIISLAVPEGIPAERIRSIGFIYPADKRLLVEAVKAMDEICFSSEEKKMFLKRAFVLNYTDDLNANYLAQKVSESGSVGLLAAGDFPHEKMYELETVFNSGGIVFKNINAGNFSKSFLADFIMELIIR